MEWNTKPLPPSYRLRTSFPFLPNPFYIGVTEGDGYDLGRLEKDWESARQTEGREIAGIWFSDSVTPVGVLDWLEENPNDGHPWLGLLMIHGEHQGKGLGREAFQGFLRFLREQEETRPLRIGVIKENKPALAFWKDVGFRPFDTIEMQFPPGLRQVVKMEISL